MTRLFKLAIGLGLLLVAGCSPQDASVPKTFTKFTATDADFVCDAPGGWAASSYGAGGISSGVTFKSGDGYIDVDSSQVGSFVADAMSPPGAMSALGVNAPPPVPAVEKLHTTYGKVFQKHVDGYKEGGMTALTVPYGDSRVSEYTATDKHGYRATILGRDRSITVNCHCAPEEWKALSPSFLRVIGSIAAGPPK